MVDQRGPYKTSAMIENSFRCFHLGLRLAKQMRCISKFHGTGPVAFTGLGPGSRNAESQLPVKNEMHDIALSFAVTMMARDAYNDIHGIQRDGERQKSRN
jgi:hypothetical protein